MYFLLLWSLLFYLFFIFLGVTSCPCHGFLRRVYITTSTLYIIIEIYTIVLILVFVFIHTCGDVSAYFRDDSFCITLYMWDQIILVLSSYIFLTHLFNLVYVIGQYTLCLCIREVGLIIKRLKWNLADMIQIWITVFTIGESFMMISCVFDRYCTGYLVSLAQMKILL